MTSREEAEKWISEQPDPEYYSVELQKDVNGRTYVVVYDNAFFGGPKPYVFFVQDEKLYVIDASFVDAKDIMDSFTFL